jgi:hypothetical protein
VDNAYNLTYFKKMLKIAAELENVTEERKNNMPRPTKPTSDTATKETTIVTRMNEIVPIEDIKAQETSPLIIETQPEIVNQINDQFELIDENVTDIELDEIEIIFDEMVALGENCTARVCRLPNYDIDQRTDSRAVQEYLGKVPFSLHIENVIKDKFGVGNYLVQLKDSHNRFFRRLSNPICIGELHRETEAVQQQPQIIQQQNPFDDKIFAAQGKLFDTVFKMMDRVGNDAPKQESQFEMFEKFLAMQKSLQTKPTTDEFTELAKELLKKQLLNPAEPNEPTIIDGNDSYIPLFIPFVSKLADTLPLIGGAAIEYFQGNAKQLENQTALENSRVKAEIIKNNQEIELKRLEIQRLMLENGQVFEDEVNTEPLNADFQPEIVSETPTPDNESNEMNKRINGLINACKTNADVEPYATELADAIKGSLVIKMQLTPLLTSSAKDVVATLNTLVLDDLTAIPNAESWVKSLQDSVNAKLV